MHHSDLDPLDLQRHGRFLRSLARSLVADAGTADDLAQDAALARLVLAERGGSLHGDDARPWLATVLRRGNLKRRRSAARRVHRETMAARPEHSPSAASLAGRMEAAERLLGHLNSLEPGLKDALAARFYDGQTFAEASEALGVPVSTVKSRVDRGLEELRRRLDQEESGGREAWLGALMGFPLVDARASAAASGGVGAGAGALWAAAAAAVVASAVGWGVFGGIGATEAQPGDVEPVTIASLKTAETATTPELTLAQPPTETSTRASIAVPPQQDQALAGSPSGRVWLLDDNGQRTPLGGTPVTWSSHLPPPEPEQLAPRGALKGLGYNVPPEPEAVTLPESIDVGRSRSGANGYFRWLGQPKAAVIYVFIAATDVHREYRWSGSQADWDALPKPHDIVLAPHGTLGGQVVDLRGNPLEGVEISLVGAASDGPSIAVSDAGGRFAFPGATGGGAPKVNLSGWTLVGSESPSKRLSGGWEDTTLVMARTGVLQLKLPKGAPRSRASPRACPCGFTAMRAPRTPMNFRATPSLSRRLNLKPWSAERNPSSFQKPGRCSCSSASPTTSRSLGACWT